MKRPSSEQKLAGGMPTWSVVALLTGAGLQIVVAALGFLVCVSRGLPFPSPVSPWLQASQVGIFAATGLWLVASAGSDRRSRSLGVAFVLIAASFGYRFVSLAGNVLPGDPGRFARTLGFLSVEAFLAPCLWIFFRDFPGGLTPWRVRLVFRVGLVLVTVSSVFLLVANLALPWSSGAAEVVLLRFSRADPRSRFWIVVYGSLLPLLPIVLARMRSSPPDERQRVKLFLGSVAVGSIPAVSYILLAAVFPDFLSTARQSLDWLLMPLIHAFVLSIPLTTAYAVVVDQILEIRLIIRTAVRYALARSTVLALTATPFLVGLVHLVQSREQTVKEVFAGAPALGLLLSLALGLAALRWRTWALAAVDRNFFRDQYDARRILSEVVRRSRAMTSPLELGELYATEVERALHLHSAGFLATKLGADGTPVRYVSLGARVPPLRSSSELVQLLRKCGGALDLEQPDSPLRSLPAEEQQWAVDSGFKLLVPMLGVGGDVLGILGLGPKRSELSFSNEDRELLSTIASAGGIALENQIIRSSEDRAAHAVDSRTEEDLASECASCGLVQERSAMACSRCEGSLEDSLVPRLLSGKFRIEQRIGRGAMGIVYRATDLSLDRPVAVKTLPRTSPERAIRLRQEARVVAAVTHPHLATIFSAETWRGLPFLVFELLTGGVLSDRIAEAPLSPFEVEEIGLTLAAALERTHHQGILHRDIKPSNIGFAADGTTKLLDFGLARIAAFAGEPTPDAEELRGSGSWASLAPRADSSLAGTPLYMSPEALLGEEADPTFDLWSLAMVLYEALAGTNPVLMPTMAQTVAAICQHPVPDVRTYQRDCPDSLAQFLSEALARERRRRPASAAEFASRLRGSSSS